VTYSTQFQAESTFLAYTNFKNNKLTTHSDDLSALWL